MKDVVELTLSPEQAYFILMRARAFDEKVAASGQDGGSNPSDDGAVDVLEDTPDDATASELRASIRRLNDDELRDLIALVWIGRGDFSMAEWNEARRAAADIGRERAPRYLLGIPLISDYLEESLSNLGFSLAEYIDEH